MFLMQDFHKALCILSLYIVVNNDIAPPSIEFIATPAKTTLIGFNPFFHAIKYTNIHANTPPKKLS